MDEKKIPYVSTTNEEWRPASEHYRVETCGAVSSTGRVCELSPGHRSFHISPGQQDEVWQ